MVRFPFFFHSALIQGFKNTKGLRLILVFFGFQYPFRLFSYLHRLPVAKKQGCSTKGRCLEHYPRRWSCPRCNLEYRAENESTIIETERVESTFEPLLLG